MAPENDKDQQFPAAQAQPEQASSSSSGVEAPVHNGGSAHQSRKVWLLAVGVVIIFLGLAGGYYVARTQYLKQTAASSNQHASQSSTQSKTAQQQVQGLHLDTTKNYGNKYANGLLPVGDGKYTTTAKQGYVYVCSEYAKNLSSGQGGGAETRGPWFTNGNTEYDLTKKSHVQGSVSWTGAFSNTISGTNRVITTNDLPNHVTGIFPIASSDPAYRYDRNPNRISQQNITYTLADSPTYGSPQCMGGEAGIMLTGVALFNAFDAGGRDAGAWEIQDGCGGHPERTGEYHYHTLSSCITDTSVSTVIGYALDGFPITGPKVGPNNILTTVDLDECHGIVSSINLGEHQTTTYHYVMTQDFPYSVSCFRAQAMQAPSAEQQTQQQPQPGQPPSGPKP